MLIRAGDLANQGEAAECEVKIVATGNHDMTFDGAFSSKSRAAGESGRGRSRRM
jgi:hypothetical protein